jgi:hypothetical protein
MARMWHATGHPRLKSAQGSAGCNYFDWATTARVRSGQARPGPWFLTGVAAAAPVSSVTLCTLTGAFPPVLVVLRAESRLMLEGRARTLSGPSSDLAHGGLRQLEQLHSPS